MKKLQIKVRVTPRDCRSTEIYFRDIYKFPLLSPEEEVKLAQRIHTGDQEALNRMVSCNLRFVVTVAKSYLNQGVELPDLISVGNQGLITAAKRFDETRGVKFCSYAVWWIRQSILHAIAKEGRAVALPANKLALLSRIKRECARLEQQLGRTLSPKEVCESLNEKEELVGRILKSAEKPLSLDAPLQSEEDIMRIDSLTDSSAPKTDDKLMKESLNEDIKTILSNLSHSESDIIKMYFGIDHSHAYSMEEIALRMSLSRERVRQIHNKAMSRLQYSSTKESLIAYL